LLAGDGELRSHHRARIDVPGRAALPQRDGVRRHLQEGKPGCHVLVGEPIELRAKGPPDCIRLLQAGQRRRNLRVDPDSPGTVVKGDSALRLELRVDGDRTLRQLGPDGIGVDDPGDAALVVVAGKHAIVGLPVGRLVRTHGDDPRAAGTQVARGRRPEHAVAYYDHVVDRIHRAWEL
jgi:hypothetical protein